MKAIIILSTIALSLLIWFGVDLLLGFIWIEDYHFTASVLITCMWYVSIDMLRTTNRASQQNSQKLEQELWKQKISTIMNKRYNIRMGFHEETSHPVLVTDKDGYVYYSDQYVHWLEGLAMKAKKNPAAKTVSI